MKIARQAGHAPKTAALGRDMMELPHCVGCAECQGLCTELVDTLILPDILLKRRPPPDPHNGEAS